MRKQPISFDSPPDSEPSYCERIDCDFLDWIYGCMCGKSEGECAEEAEGRAEELRELMGRIREER